MIILGITYICNPVIYVLAHVTVSLLIAVIIKRTL
jgi:hypothetical protein